MVEESSSDGWGRKAGGVRTRHRPHSHTLSDLLLPDTLRFPHSLFWTPTCQWVNSFVKTEPPWYNHFLSLGAGDQAWKDILNSGYNKQPWYTASQSQLIWSLCPCPLNARTAVVCYHPWLIWRWGWNQGPKHASKHSTHWATLQSTLSLDHMPFSWVWFNLTLFDACRFRSHSLAVSYIHCVARYTVGYTFQAYGLHVNEIVSWCTS